MNRKDCQINELPSSNRKLVIFEELVEIATNPDLENVVLFGMKRFYVEDTREYDLIFHVKTDVDNPYLRVKPSRWIIPVLKVNHLLSAHTISEHHSQHPSFTRFALSGRPLSFWDITQDDRSNQVRRVKKCKMISEQVFWDHVQLPEMMRHVGLMRRAIDRRFKQCFRPSQTLMSRI